ncbi:uncharacterized protein EDB91DRAFT_1134438 [Suillus paluster]|uniref:uncharacterized protein n=1 Tax=Suillus paluster TaxID=48578 RepID=UPI001B86FD60|nr:uncharacterized protein EDB91DRAFT_1134438 [Suillus paluster]KAG1739911.1 hypothetical protein EDB91DRAFT_1134438 [Suillus paluster]
MPDLFAMLHSCMGYSISPLIYSTKRTSSALYLNRSAVIECLAVFPSVLPTPPQVRCGRNGKHALYKINGLAWLFYCTCVVFSLPTLMDKIMQLLSMAELFEADSRGPYITTADYLPPDDDRSYTHPLHNFVCDTHTELTDSEHRLLHLFATPSKDTQGPHGLAQTTQNTSGHITKKFSRLGVHLVSPQRVNPSPDPTPLGPRCVLISVLDLPPSFWPTLFTDERLARNREVESRVHRSGYHRQYYLFLKALIIHGILKITDVEWIPESESRFFL